MTDQELLTQFESLTGDTLDQTLEIQLANNAKNKVETEQQLQILKELDTSQTSVVGGTYLTPYNLPATFLQPLDHGTIYVGTKRRRQVPYEKRLDYKDSSDYFYINYRTNQFFLCGTVTEAETITFPYLVATTDITDADLTGTTVTWPSRFHSLIPYEMAFMWFAIDQGDKSRSFAPEWLVAYQQLKNSLVAWDQALKLAAIDGATPYGAATPAESEDTINFN